MYRTIRAQGFDTEASRRDILQEPRVLEHSHGGSPHQRRAVEPGRDRLDWSENLGRPSTVS
jgi:hypothetical protein